MPSCTGSPYPPSSRRGTLRYLHESTAKVAIFANLRKDLPIFSQFWPIVCAFSASFPSAHLPFFNSLIPLPFFPLSDIAQSPMPFLPEITDIPPGKSSILCANPPTNRQEKEWNVRTLLRKLYLCLNIRVDFSQRAAQLLGHWQESLVLSCGKIHTLCTLFKGYHLKLKTLHGSFSASTITYLIRLW